MALASPALEFGAQSVSITDTDGTELVVDQVDWNYTGQYGAIKDMRVLDEAKHCHVSICEGFVQKGCGHNNEYSISAHHVKIDSSKLTLERRFSDLITTIMNETLVTVISSLISLFWPPSGTPTIHVQPAADIDVHLAMDSIWIPNMNTKVKIPAASTEGWSGFAEHLSGSFRSEYIRSLVLP